MTTVSEVLKALDAAAPLNLAADFDNAGFLAGRGDARVEKVLVALDITGQVIDEAIEKGANLIVSHHPLIFGEINSVTDVDVTGRLLCRLLENNISAICMHTNLDFAKGGVNDALAEIFGILDVSPVEPMCDGTIGGGRMGTLPTETELSDFLPIICEKLSCSGVRYYDAGRKVRKIALGGGACGDYVELAKSLGCDTLVTSDIKHNRFIDARELSINLVDAGHFETENIICPRICETIKNSFPKLQVDIAERNVAPASYFTV